MFILTSGEKFKKTVGVFYSFKVAQKASNKIYELYDTHQIEEWPLSRTNVKNVWIRVSNVWQQIVWGLPGKKRK